jgi:tetratricopeptide (TPR) repeat protein
MRVSREAGRFFMKTTKKEWIALLRPLVWPLFVAVALGCAPRGSSGGGTPEEAAEAGETPAEAGARESGGAHGALDRMNEDKAKADELLASGRYADAAELLSPWAAAKVADPQVYSMLARSQWKLGQHQDAVHNYEESLRLDYSAAYTHLELAELLLENGKSGRALTEFELAVQYGRGDPLPHYNYGLALYDLGRAGDAIAQWEIAYSRDPRDPRYAEAMGIGLSESDPGKAREYFETAMANGADHPGIHNNLGLLLERLGDMTGAEAELKKAVAGDPEDAGYRRNLAIHYMNSSQPALAAPIWEALHREQPEDASWRIYLGRAYLELGRFEDSVRLLEEWLEKSANTLPGKRQSRGGPAASPGADEAYAVLAMSFRGLSRLDRAATCMKKAVDLSPDNVAHLINYGVILAEDGKIAEAKDQWERALRLDPENATAKQNLSAYPR